MRSTQPARSSVIGIACATAVVLVAGCAGCAPQSPDRSSWRDQAYQTLDEVSSNVATASLLVGQVQQDRDTYRHVTTVLSDAGDVLAQVRIAIVRRDTAAYPRLLRQLSATSRELSRTEQGIGGRTG
jgi:outer membrane murein-binding lipoprotein Lpp